MADIVPPEERSRMMSGIRGRDTKPEIALRSGLHRLGLRYTLKSRMPGRPDLVLPKWRAAVFFHGCFWHGHACPLFRLPATRTEFWRQKIDGNRARDANVVAQLLDAGWRVAIVRECAVRGTTKRPWGTVCREIAEWIRSGQGGVLEIDGDNTGRSDFTEFADMKRGSLSEYFVGLAAKNLSSVEANPSVSNQHEFNGVSELKRILGLEKKKLTATFIYLSDENEEPLTADGFLTWYDARENHPTRSEYRLYFPTTTVSQRFGAGDLFVMGLRKDGSALCIVAERGSTPENQVRFLLGIDREEMFPEFEVQDEGYTDAVPLNYVSRLILDEIGVEQELEPEAEPLLERILGRFGPKFPTTKEFSSFARDTSQLDPRDDPDEVLIAWMDLEELAFRALERHVISERLKDGFGDADGGADVDGFIAFSLGVQNRRKSRAGYALENHLEAVFTAHDIRYNRAAVTENKSKPDFLFPGITEYRDPAFPPARLSMLAAKTSAKDRWRQILGEADRISSKHLITLEPGISENQTEEMKARSVSLVLPRPIHPTYTADQRNWLFDLAAFIDIVTARQDAA